MPLSRQQFQELRDQGLSVDQIVKFDRGEKPKSAGVGGFKGFALGFGKKIASTVKGGASLGEKLFRPAQELGRKGAELVTGQKTESVFGQPTGAENIAALAPEGTFDLQGTAEKAGGFVEQIGELLIPVPGLKVVGAGKGLAAVGKFAAKEGVELAGKTALQQGEINKEVGTAGLFGIGGGIIGKLAEIGITKAAPAVSKWLEKVNLRLTPVQKSNLQGKVDSVIETIRNKKITGSPQRRLEKINDIYEAQEDIVQGVLKQAKGKTVNKETLIEQLNGLKKKYSFERDSVAIDKQIDGVIETLNIKFPDEIPVDTLNLFKRSTYKNAYNKAGDKVLDSVEHDVGDILRLDIEKATEGLIVDGKNLAAINKEYGDIIEARKLLKIASGRKEIGLIGRLLVMSVGGSIGSAGGPVGTAVGLVAAQPVASVLAGTAARSLISRGLDTIAKLPLKEAEAVLTRLILQVIQGQKDQEKGSQ